ncbi:MAG: IS21 family transposase [Chloroflexota bacterium]|nr:IS21 family transposase [Chloroflexota bacterium]
MKTDAEVRRYMKERSKGRTQAQAAAKAGMSLGTARKYERAARVPSQLKQPRTYRTHPNPFADDWPWVVEQLGRDPALQAKTLFGLLIERAPDRYRPGQLRTFQRHVAAWRLEHGPGKEVIFPQVHRPGVAVQSDFTHMDDLNISLGGVPFPHLLFHLVFVYSNVEAVRVCFAESFEALVEGLEAGLWALGGVPRQHRTDHLGAAIRPLDHAGQAQARERYAAVMRHYGMEPTVNNAGMAHENGDVEQAHHRCKEAVDQALRARGSRDFPDRAAYERFLQELVRRRNATREGRWAEERAALRPLPATPLAPCREVQVRVGRFSTIQVLRNTYSVPARLIGATVLVRVRAETLELYRGTARLLTLPRLLGHGRHRIDYRHVIWSLVRKPGAFANYRYHDDLFPTVTFRRAYDALAAGRPERADREYVRVLHLAASTSEAEVEAALALLLEQRAAPTLDAVRELVRLPGPAAVPELTATPLDLGVYDRLLGGEGGHA